jgi:uncharacterized protein (TIGR03083 family)
MVTPRYDGVPVLQFAGATTDPSVPLLSQRRRLIEALRGLEPAQWAVRSRCDAWSVREVAAHVAGLNELWVMSIVGALQGTPTRLFEGFDPVTTPPRLLEATRAWTPEETLARLVKSNEELTEAVTGLDDDSWSLIGESPLGRVVLHLVAVHALWDGWIHERDILLPLGLVAGEAHDEMTACLWYVAALGPALRATRGATRAGCLGLLATDPDSCFVVEAGSRVVVRPGEPPPGAARLAGRVVDLIEGLSFRTPLRADFAPDDRWLLAGLDETFDRA